MADPSCRIFFLLWKIFPHAVSFVGCVAYVIV